MLLHTIVIDWISAIGNSHTQFTINHLLVHEDHPRDARVSGLGIVFGDQPVTIAVLPDSHGSASPGRSSNGSRKRNASGRETGGY
jgi:hypothetical protein